LGSLNEVQARQLAGLKQGDYSLQSNRKIIEGCSPPENEGFVNVGISID
jgi:hypothetical protein